MTGTEELSELEMSTEDEELAVSEMEELELAELALDSLELELESLDELVDESSEDDCDDELIA